MYLPSRFEARDRAVALQLMRAHPFAALAAVDDEGLPFISQLPMVVQERDDDGLTIWCHCAKPNPLWRHLQARPRARVLFQGPHAYMSPSVYPDLARVPTWNYLSVQCVVDARLVESPDEKDALLKRLISEHEPAYDAQWRALGEEFQQKMLTGIVGLELRVMSLQCAVKLNQHRPEAHAAMHAIYSAGNAQEQALAEWMRACGLVPGVSVQSQGN
ncbi:FMN-binding negative transcriptional regulator [Variovorax dokdonensis]|uniref:FMN-binding negative transcriptional regulator n=1 Tax=Variovorax dokdonensis TaxID=344883 RepID=A0ABT7N8S0_9BURK|nr:FMN-binding negative transcriptional regulator [Variovorax dokdonensis]MDM0044341.1 FMN-binding negative transcriptional regulator [Variovorax dokdonensis]